MAKYNYAEAFCLMRYRCKAGHDEQIWNSRDGVTPFMMSCRCGAESQHVDWKRDLCMPAFVPPVGSRIFVDLTLEKAREYCRRRVEQGWDDPDYPMSENWPTKEAAVEELAASAMDPPGQPDVLVVTEDNWPPGAPADGTGG